MEFVNNTDEGIMVQVEPRHWKGVNPGEKIELKERKGKAYGLTPLKDEVEEDQGEQSDEQPEETNENEETNDDEEQESFKVELESIQGVGEKTVKDLLEIYSSRQELLEDIQNGEHIPVRNDQEKKLKEHFGNME